MTRPHKYRPFTTRDGSLACADCYGRLDSDEHRLGAVSDEFVAAVEHECGMGAEAWDTINPREIIIAVVKVAPRFGGERR